MIYEGANDASRVPPEWHGWLHGSYDGVPESYLPPARIWKWTTRPTPPEPLPPIARMGALERGGQRAAATGDYEAWTPDA